MTKSKTGFEKRQENRKERQANRVLDAFSEFQDIAHALSECSRYSYSARIEDAETRVPILYLDCEEEEGPSFFAKPDSSGGRDKYRIRVSVPPMWRRDYEPDWLGRPSIGVTYTRGPQTVAKDLRRRLMEEAKEYWNALRDAREEALSEEKQMESEIEEIGERTAANARKKENGDSEATLYGEAKGNSYGKLKQDGPDSYRFDRLGGLTKEQAIQVLQVLSGD